MSAPEDTYVLVVKTDCPTCHLIAPAVQAISAKEIPLQIYCQDSPSFDEMGTPVTDDRELAFSWRSEIETVPTLIRIRNGEERGRCVGWVREEWRTLLGIANLGEALPEHRPGCGSLTRNPGMSARLRAKFDFDQLQSRALTPPLEIDPFEYCYEQGWSDGLPVLPPTPERVMAMLEGTNRNPDEVLGNMPPDLAPVSVEKIAINAVLAGCKPEYLPVVIAAVEASLLDEFCMHGLLATTYFSGPMLVVSGPVARRIGMNAGGNAFGQGNRANATIGRALQLVVRNLGGGKPGGIDRATLGNPGKYTFCFAEDDDPEWSTLRQDQGFGRSSSTVTLFAADGVQGIVDQKSREPDSLCRSFAAGLRVVSHPKMVMAADAFLVISPEHARVFHEAGWSKEKVRETLLQLLMIPGSELVVGAGGIAEGIPLEYQDKVLPKFREGGLNIVRAGGSAGMFSAIIAGWGASGSMGSSPVTKEIES